ncbi:hypothetical protein QWY82_04575 [Simiduia curdlanivorans]|uniref:ABM domain-containing protein n=1 Tax=Simiduia curdlanivorans TaxID=1492769 RepID=A0ABV8V1R0_9GAMM|nr:hypothetical protein [Simiduia curdlanivorans]MDN3638082.1 hypothetical protein [Simiduia curdlanivorans]
MSDVIEIVQFETKKGVQATDFIRAAEPIGSWVMAQPGFRYRSLSQDEQGLWRDVVYWSSMENAKKASDAFMRDNAQSDFMVMIEESSLVMNHSRVMQSQMAECS